MENLQEFLKEIEDLFNSVEDADLTVHKFHGTPPAYGYVVRSKLIKNEDGTYTHWTPDK
jgi:hypothetical protein